VIVLGVLVVSAGGFLAGRLAFSSSEPAPVAQSAKPKPKAQEPSAKRAGPKIQSVSEQVQSEEQGETPARPAGAPPKGDDKPLVLSELDKKLDSYHKMIKPQPGEWKFAEVPWERSVWDARKKAAAEGKPLFIWYMAGEPLGQC
jgi:hypothetical protein